MADKADGPGLELAGCVPACVHRLGRMVESHAVAPAKRHPGLPTDQPEALGQQWGPVALHIGASEDCCSAAARLDGKPHLLLEPGIRHRQNDQVGVILGHCHCAKTQM